jgi:hypothetical protein
MTYRPKGKRFLGRPLKPWRETVTEHSDLIRVRKKKNKKKKVKISISSVV